MATPSVMAENLGYDLSAFEVSFLEESLMEDADDERLTSVMQSLEAEISSASREDLRASESYSTSSDLDFDWTDAEMPCSSPSEEMNSMLLDYSADEIEDAVMFVDIEHHTQFWDGVFLEEHGYSSLWQEPYNSM